MKKKISVLCIACLCALTAAIAFGCSSDVKYYHLTYVPQDGLRFIGEIYSGAEVKEGVTVRFTLEINEDKLTGEPVVKANDTVLSPDANGEYSFVMTADTAVEVSGVFPITSYRVTFDEGEFRTRYECADGDVENGFSVEAGESIRFKVLQSVYYVGTPTVCANTTILTKGADGYYTASVTENINITVTGLTIDTPFDVRENGGTGSATNPFIIERPIDLYELASLISDGFYAQAAVSHYRMVKDIDLEGEQLYVIGDGTTETSVFSGVFDGNGYTISNYRIEDYIIEQSAFQSVFLPYIGVFGRVAANSGGPAEIRNLHLENFTIDVDATKGVGVCTVGSLVGYGIGVNIVGCSAEGTLSVNGARNDLTYAGGLVGVLQSVYVTEDLRFVSVLRSCSTDVSIDGRGGLLYAGGGLVGYLRAIEARTPAVILNSYTTGYVQGFVNAGGIAGATTAYTAVENSYATGDITATSLVNYSVTEDDRLVSIQLMACAGGITGYADLNTVITDSFAAGFVSAIAQVPNPPDELQRAGGVIGYAAYNVSQIGDEAAYAHNCFGATEIEEAEISDIGTWVQKNLNWNDGDWVFTADAYPTVNKESTDMSYTVTVQHVNAAGQTTATAKNEYITMAFWDLREENRLPSFIQAGDKRSYGYFFDETLRKRVPVSYVPTGDVTLYAGFADYGEIAGTYYVQTDEAGGRVTVELQSNGTLVYRNGAQKVTSYYTYNGTFAVLHNTALGDHLPREAYNFRATKDGSVLTLHDLDSWKAAEDAEPQALPLTAYAESRAFAYGTYYGSDKTYTFFRDGTGTIEANGSTESFTFVPPWDTAAAELTVVAESGTFTAALSGGKVTQIGAANVSETDMFAGTWESAANDRKQYAFDGRGGYTYTTADGTQATGSYTVSGNGITFAGKTATFDDDKFLTIDGETFYAAHSFTGAWLLNRKVPVEVRLNGISTDGYGTAVADYGAVRFDLSYAATAGGIVLYYEDVLFGELTYNATDYTLRGKLYATGTDSVEEGAVLCAYDDYKGAWVSGDETIRSAEFNGLGEYNINGTASYLAVRGTIRINGETTAVRYTLTHGTKSGAFTYNDTEYTVRLSGDTVIVAGSGRADISLKRRDDWYGFELRDGDKTVYTFDGRGNVSGGGTLTATSAAGEETKYTYTLTGDTVNVTAGGQSGTITAQNGKYVFALGGNKDLYVNVAFAGNWIVGASIKDTLAIGEIGPNGHRLTANGKYNGVDVEFVYSRKDGGLTFTYKDETSKNVVCYVTAHTAKTENGNNVDELRLLTGESSRVCVRADADYIDSYRGEYKTSDPDRLVQTIVMDGFSGCYFGSDGTAVVTEIDGTGTVTGTITYTFDAFDYLVFRVYGVVQYMFVPADDGAYLKTGTNERYDLIEPDIFYDAVAYGPGEDDEIDYDTKYIFDGIGNVFAVNASDDEDTVGDKLYTYEALERTDEDKLNNEYRFVFTDAKTNKTYNAVLDIGSTDFVLTMTEKA